MDDTIIAKSCQTTGYRVKSYYTNMQTTLETKDIKYIVLSIVLIVASISFLKTTVSILKSNQRFEDLRSEVTNLEKERAYINEELEYKKSPEFIEQEARNKLNMLKPNEKVYVFEESPDSEEVLGDSAPNVASDVIKTSNWKLWFNLVF